jgi:hypothetical protein
MRIWGAHAKKANGGIWKKRGNAGDISTVVRVQFPTGPLNIVFLQPQVTRVSETIWFFGRSCRHCSRLLTRRRG